VNRGQIVVVAARGAYSGKTRPAVVVQSDDFASTTSVTVCLMTSAPVDAPLLRVQIEPNPFNGLADRSWVMVDKVVTVPRRQIGRSVGRLNAADVTRLNRGLAVFLGLGG